MTDFAAMSPEEFRHWVEYVRPGIVKAREQFSRDGRKAALAIIRRTNEGNRDE